MYNNAIYIINVTYVSFYRHQKYVHAVTKLSLLLPNFNCYAFYFLFCLDQLPGAYNTSNERNGMFAPL